MFVLDFTKPYMYANTIAFYQGNLSTNNTLRCKLKTGSIEDLTGYACTATFYVNGVEIVETCKIIDRASCIVDIILPSNALVAGEHKMEVILTKPNVSTIQSPMLKYEVWQGLTTGEGIEGTAEYPVLVELINNTQLAIDKTNELQTEVKASLVLANEEINKIPIKVQEKVDEITSNIDPIITDIEQNEAIRQANEAERIKEEDIRKVNEKARIDAELVREHNDADHEKAEAIRETNEENRRVAELGRVDAETKRVKAESDRVVAENKRVEAENKRQENYDFMTGDEERRRLEENKRIEAEKVRVASETERISEENKRRTVELSRVKAEDARNTAENTRKSNETTRQAQETARVQAETTRQTKYDKLVQDTNNSVNSFNQYTTQAKADEETRKANEVKRVEAETIRTNQESTRESNEATRKRQEDIRVARDENRETVFQGKVRAMDAKIAEGTAKITEVNTAKNTMVADTKKAIDKMKTDFNALTASQQQDAEVITARDGEESLNARLERDLAKGKIVSETLEGSYITCADTIDGIITDIEVLGSTVQNPENLADIKSVGIDNGDGTYTIEVASCNENLFDGVYSANTAIYTDGNKVGQEYASSGFYASSNFIKVKPNTTYVLKDGNQRWVVEYDANKKGIYGKDYYSRFTTRNDTMYIKFYTVEAHKDNFIISEGTDIKPYVEQVKSKCTIKLPCELTKIDAKYAQHITQDKLYYDNIENAWCIMKYNDWVTVDGTQLPISARVSGANQNVAYVEFDCFDTIIKDNGNECISDRFTYLSMFNGTTADKPWSVCTTYTASKLRFTLPAETFTSITTATLKDWFKENPTKVLIRLKTPKKIVLPLDVQIQLTQYLGTTNAWLECGEVEGTLKATFNKSIASTVLGNTKAINSLDTRVKNIEGLKETQDFEYKTTTGRLVCKETKTGTIKDIKISGKSLINLCEKRKFTAVGNGSSLVGDIGKLSQSIGNGIEYTVIVKVPSNFASNKCFFRGYDDKGTGRANIFDGNELYNNRGSVLVKKVQNSVNFDTLVTNVRLIANNDSTDTFSLDDVMVIIGDYTQNTPSYFEGIGSVGNGVDKIEVLSMNNGNLIDSNNIIKGKYLSVTGKQNAHDNSFICDYFINIQSNMKIRSNQNCIYNYFNKNKEYISGEEVTSNKYATIPNDAVFMKIGLYNRLDIISSIYVGMSENDTFIPYKQDKKLILFKDTDGTWKPVTELRGLAEVCDTIELHADGKYYYHQRTTSKVLTGGEGENWLRLSNFDTTNTERYALYVADICADGEIISNRLKHAHRGGDDMSTCIYIHNEDKRIDIKKLKTDNRWTDLVTFKEWLQTNNLTVVYQLADEKVFEVNPLFLDAFEGETLFQVLSGVVNAEVELKITSYISGLVNANTRRIKELENEIFKGQEAQNAVILENDLRIIDLELALMDAMPGITFTLGGENMQERSQLYFDFLKGRIESGNYTDEYLERVINKYLQGKRITQEEYDMLYDMIYPPVYDLPQE